MEFTPMTIIRCLSLLTLAGMLSLTAGVAMAQHDTGSGGGATSGGATSGGESTSRAPVRRTTTRRPATVRKPTAPVRRGITAEQYNKQGDDFFEAKEYDDALEAYAKAVQLKPIASAYYEIGWIYNDQGQYSQAIEPLRQAASFKANYAEAQEELGYAYYKLERSQEAIAAYRSAVSMKPDFGLAYIGLGDVFYYQTKQ